MASVRDLIQFLPSFCHLKNPPGQTCEHALKLVKPHKHYKFHVFCDGKCHENSINSAFLMENAMDFPPNRRNRTLPRPSPTWPSPRGPVKSSEQLRLLQDVKTWWDMIFFNASTKEESRRCGYVQMYMSLFIVFLSVFSLAAD